MKPSKVLLLSCIAVLSVLSLPFTPVAQSQEVRMDKTGMLLDRPGSQQSPVHLNRKIAASTPVSVLVANPNGDTPDRLRGLGYTVSVSLNGLEISRSYLQNFDVLWADVGTALNWADPLPQEVRAWVNEDGGGLVVVQPDTVGQHLLFPAGFDVYISSDLPPAGHWGSAVFDPTHPITQGITMDWDLPVNGDTVWIEDIGTSWDILAVGRTLAKDGALPEDAISVLAGEYGQGRLVYNNGNFASGSAGPASDEFVIQMVNWLAQYEPPPPWGAAATAEASSYGSKAKARSGVVNHLGILLIPGVAVLVLRMVRRRT